MRTSLLVALLLGACGEAVPDYDAVDPEELYGTWEYTANDGEGMVYEFSEMDDGTHPSLAGLIDIYFGRQLFDAEYNSFGTFRIEYRDYDDHGNVPTLVLTSGVAKPITSVSSSKFTLGFGEYPEEYNRSR